MEGETKKDLQSLIESIKSSDDDDLECRISIISQIGDSYLINTCDLAQLIDWLLTCWDDTSSFGTLQSMLNKTILGVAAKYMESDVSSCLSQFLMLGTKASMWCRKHLQGSRDDNLSNLFSQLLLDTLSFATASLSTLTRSPILGESVVMHIVENFIFENLNLTKEFILEVKSLYIASELVKAAQVVLDAAIKLCRAYFQSSKCDTSQISSYSNEEPERSIDAYFAGHIVNITACTIQSLFELGVFAASGGGSLVSVLNVSWKGVVSLLHLGKGVISEKVNVGEIILTLVTMATESLRHAGEAWFSTKSETLAISEAKRMFLPIKFYLINAVRISLDYPCKAVNLYKEISQCVLLISFLSISLSKETHLRGASGVLVEFLEPTSFHLLHALLNSADLNSESKFLILEWLFTNETDASSKDPMEVDSSTGNSSFDGIYNLDCISMPKAEVLLLARFLLFLNILKSSSDLKEEMVLAISKKLDYILDTLVHGHIYSITLGWEIPVLSPGSVPGVTWEPLFSSVVHSLKIFMIVASSNKLAWVEAETFLLQNVIHSHFLCVEVVVELLSFIMRHADAETTTQLLESLCHLLKTIASVEPDLHPNSSLRKMARSLCNLLSWNQSTVVDQVYTSISGDEKYPVSYLMNIALLMEGFPFDSLSDGVKAGTSQKLVAAFCVFLESNYSELVLNASSDSCTHDTVGMPVQALSSALQSCHIKSSNIVDEKLGSQVLKFTLSLIHGNKSARNGMKDRYAMLLGAALNIISTTEHLYVADKIGELILELQTLFTAVSSESDTSLCRLKPFMASFLSNLFHIDLPFSEGSVIGPAVCSLYQVLLRERHWAFSHVALSAFVYFAERSSCTELWRFVPEDAALSFDPANGKEVNSERFSSEMRALFEKSPALKGAYSCQEQLSYLVKEGLLLNELSNIPDPVNNASTAEIVEIIDDKCVKNKKRKLDGVSEGIELLQNGLKVMSNALAQADTNELKEKLSPYISSLEDAISHLVDLSG